MKVAPLSLSSSLSLSHSHFVFILLCFIPIGLVDIPILQHAENDEDCGHPQFKKKKRKRRKSVSRSTILIKDEDFSLHQLRE